MSALERELLERFRQLDDAAQQRVLALLAQESGQAESMSLQAWLDALIQAGQKAIGAPVGVQSVLDEVREEASSWPRSAS